MNKSKPTQYFLDWAQNNPELYQEYLNKKKKTINPLACFYHIIRSSIKRKTKRDELNQILGCSPNEFRKHIENQFDENMNWDNYGEYWNIDHIIPTRSVSPDNLEKMKEVFHYSNCRPVLRFYNNSKSDIMPDGGRARNIPKRII